MSEQENDCTEGCSETCYHKWVITPSHSSDFDSTVSDDDQNAFDLAHDVLESIFYQIEPGETMTLRITCNAVGKNATS